MSDPDSRDPNARNRSLLDIYRAQEGRTIKPASVEPAPVPEMESAPRPVDRKAANANSEKPDEIAREKAGPGNAEAKPASRRNGENPLFAALSRRLKKEKKPKTPVVKSAPALRSNAGRIETTAMTRNAPRDRSEPAPDKLADAVATQGNPYWRPLIDPAKVVMGVVASKWLIVAMTVLGAVIGALIALSTPKDYYAATELLFDPRDIQIVDRDLTKGGLPSDATLALIENQVRVITSGSVLTKVVDRLHLQDDPEFNGQADEGILHLLTHPRAIFSWGDEKSDASIRWTLAVGHLADSLDVRRNEKTFIIDIGVTTHDAQKSANIANMVASVFTETYGDMQSKTATRANDEITSRLGDLRASVEESEKAVADFKSKHDIVDAQGRPISDDSIVKVNDQLSTARARTAELQARADSARGVDPDSVLGSALPEQVASPALAELRAQYASLKQQADRLANKLGPRHPDRQALEAQLAGLRQQISNELNRIVASLKVDVKRAIQTQQQLAARLAQLKVEKGRLADEQVQLNELQREADSRRAVYEAFLQRARETGQQRGLNTGNVNIISEAYPPLDPTGPSRAVIAIAGMFLGFLAGIALGAARGAVNSFRENSTTGSARRSPARAVSASAVPVSAARKPDATKARRDETRAAEPEAADRYRHLLRGTIDATPPLDPSRRAGEHSGSRPAMHAGVSQQTDATGSSPRGVRSARAPQTPELDERGDDFEPRWVEPADENGRDFDPRNVDHAAADDFREGEAARAEIDELRRELRAFRREVDALAALRASRLVG